MKNLFTLFMVITAFRVQANESFFSGATNSQAPIIQAPALKTTDLVSGISGYSASSQSALAYNWGGIVFYSTPGGFHGLIAANTNIGNTAPFDFINRSTDPVWHNANNTANGGNLYLDWRAPTYSQLLLLYAARNTPGFNLGSGILISSSNDDNDPFAFTCIDFST